MGAVRFGFQLANQGFISRVISGVAEAPKDLTEAFTAIRTDFYQTNARRFDAEGGSEGLPIWSPLSDRPPGHGYRSWKAKHYPGAPILHLRGSLRRSLTEQGGANVGRVGPLSLEFGTALRVGKWNLGMLHQTGYQVKTKNEPIDVPPRPPLWLSGPQKNRITRILRMGVTDAVERQVIQARLAATAAALPFLSYHADRSV